LVAAAAIPVFYLPALFFDGSTHYTVADTWRFWIIHLWVEGFELFVTVIVAIIFHRLGLYQPTLDPLTGEKSGILDRCTKTGTCPKPRVCVPDGACGRDLNRLLKDGGAPALLALFAAGAIGGFLCRKLRKCSQYSAQDWT
jgi:hypothetical protein